MILVNGDSMTTGYGLDQHGTAISANQAWPAQLSRMIGKDVINIALGGSSNQRIHRTTVEMILSGIRPDLVILGWSMAERAEYPQSDTPGDWARAYKTAKGMGLPKAIFSQLHFDYIQRDWASGVDRAMAITAMTDFLELRKIPYVNFNSFPPEFATSGEIPVPSWFEPRGFIPEDMHGYVYRRLYGEDPQEIIHPPKEGHEVWAQHVLTHIQENGMG